MVMTRSLYLCFSQTGFPVSSSFHSLDHCPRVWLSSCVCVCVWLANEGYMIEDGLFSDSGGYAIATLSDLHVSQQVVRGIEVCQFLERKEVC